MNILVITALVGQKMDAFLKGASMSKHIFEQTVDDQTMQVQIGWDRPMQNYYGVISPWVEDADMEEGGYFDDCDPLFSNLFSPKKLSLDEIAEEVTKRGLIIPDGLLNNVINDQWHNTANKITIYENGQTKYHDFNTSAPMNE